MCDQGAARRSDGRGPAPRSGRLQSPIRPRAVPAHGPAADHSGRPDALPPGPSRLAPVASASLRPAHRGSCARPAGRGGAARAGAAAVERDRRRPRGATARPVPQCVGGVVERLLRRRDGPRLRRLPHQRLQRRRPPGTLAVRRRLQHAHRLPRAGRDRHAQRRGHRHRGLAAAARGQRGPGRHGHARAGRGAAPDRRPGRRLGAEPLPRCHRLPARRHPLPGRGAGRRGLRRRQLDVAERRGRLVDAVRARRRAAPRRRDHRRGPGRHRWRGAERTRPARAGARPGRLVQRRAAPRLEWRAPRQPRRARRRRPRGRHLAGGRLLGRRLVVRSRLRPREPGDHGPRRLVLGARPRAPR